MRRLKKQGFGQISRRDFLKDAGLMVGAPTIGTMALLDRNNNSMEADARDALGGNLCRCATYQQHTQAVLEAAKNL
jgi:aerobic-type carbon monoxide dehydrogenase small subunit (CoxS/CutS family)